MNSLPASGIKRLAVFNRAAKALVILAVALSLGLHWVLLQGVAWTGMFVSFAHQTTISEAFTKTFNGKNPCRICKLVRAGQQSEKATESLLTFEKIESLPCASEVLLMPPLPSPALATDDHLAYSTHRVSRTTVIRICPG